MKSKVVILTLLAAVSAIPVLAQKNAPKPKEITIDGVEGFQDTPMQPDGKLLSAAYATVILNGVILQNYQAIRGDTNWRVPGSYTPVGTTGPLGLQFHNHSVSFRNIWVRPVPVVNEPRTATNKSIKPTD